MMLKKVLLGIAVLLLAACATTTKTETRKVYSPTSTVAVGNEVRVVTKDGRTLEFLATAVDAKTIQGKGISVARADVASMQVVSGSTTVQTSESSAAPAVQAVSTVAIVIGVVCILVVAIVI